MDDVNRIFVGVAANIGLRGLVQHPTDLFGKYFVPTKTLNDIKKRIINVELTIITRMNCISHCICIYGELHSGAYIPHSGAYT